jgi:hypothetical protein
MKMIVFAMLALLIAGGNAMSANVVEADLNGLHFTIDSETGSILSLQYDGPGKMLDSTPERAGLVDLAYPHEKFEPRRLASRYSKGAQIMKDEKQVIIRIPSLGSSREVFPVNGSVSATVRLAEASDGKSVIMTCEIKNDSDQPVRQVLFPDFPGLLPFDGSDSTWFRTGGFGGLPFLELAPNEDKASQCYMTDFAAYSVEHKAGGIFNDMFVRWMDFGGLTGGLSLFPKRWGSEPQVTVRLQLSEVEEKIRLMCLHDVTIKPGEKWESGEFWLTPHKQGWAKGIEPYREWVKKNYKREFPVPQRVREGLGYRTVWMCQTQPDDPQDAIFRFEDLPKLAAECKDHGLNEMVMWAWCKGFVLPLPPPFPHLGTEQDFANAAKECSKIGVNLTPFISVLQANPETAPRYGLKVTDNNGWTYHTELIPRWNPPYATAYSCVQVGPLNPKWHEDVLDGCKHLVDIGVTSLSWDQFWTTNDPPPNMLSLASQIRAYAKKSDPEATFSGEELWNLELDSSILDYTWNWGGYRDCRAFTSVFPTPRINCCVSFSPLVVKKAFADNLFLNVMPRKKESANASDRISSYPELSKALKQCAGLRKTFLPYFLDGTLIGDCILSQPCPGTHVTAYVLPKSVLMIVINQGGERKVPFACNLDPWLKADRYEIKAFDENGKLLGTSKTGSEWHAETKMLESGEMTLFEIRAGDR